MELDPKTMMPLTGFVPLMSCNRAQLGWEVCGDHNTDVNNPWLEGAFMTKHNGRYYLQYSVPGTQFKSYCDTLYISNIPLGPFTVAKHNPFAYKPEGFANGIGHGSTFCDVYGNYWHIGTVAVSVYHMFERRLSSPDELILGWMLLTIRAWRLLLHWTDDIRHRMPLMRIFVHGGVQLAVTKVNLCLLIWEQRLWSMLSK